MIAGKNELLDIMGRALFIAFIMLALSSFSDSPAVQLKAPMQLEQAMEYLAVNSNTIIVELAKVPVYSQHSVSRIDKLNLNTFNEGFKIKHDSRIVLQKKIFIEKLALTIKPIPIYTHTLHLFSEKCDDNLILS